MLPDDEWWIKSDGCDVISGITESMRLEWGGDVDLGDGKLQAQRKEYLDQISLVKGLVRDTTVPHKRSLVISDLKEIKKIVDRQLCVAPEGIVV